MNTVLWIDESATGTPTCLFKDGPERLQVLFAASFPAAFELLKTHPMVGAGALPIADFTAAEALQLIHDEGCRVPIVLYEPAGVVSKALELTQGGAFQYVSHAVKPEELCELLAVAIRHHGAQREASANAKTGRFRAAAQVAATCWLAPAAPMREVVEIIDLVGNRRSTVLITGETGTGKEVAARRAACSSSRSGSRMVAVNCAALPDNLLEAELFGHTKGAFTGASTRAWGCLSRPTAAPYFWTKSARCRCSCKPSCCGFCRSASSSASAARNRFPSMSA